MEWNKAGRPRTKQAEQETKEEDSPWTKQELSIVAANELGRFQALAIAVVKQWIYDGHNQNDYHNILPWLGIVKQCNNVTKNTYTIGDTSNGQ